MLVVYSTANGSSFGNVYIMCVYIMCAKLHIYSAL